MEKLIIKKAAIIIIILLILPLIFIYSKEKEEKGKEYSDGKRGKVYLPQGDMSFADEVVSQNLGKPSPKGFHAEAKYALGPPDWTKSNKPGASTLGCGGILVVQFTDNVLVDVEGTDLYVFEVGPAVESTNLATSYDGKNWIDVGTKKEPNPWVTVRALRTLQLCEK